jgi:hypothetical protein
MIFCEKCHEWYHYRCMNIVNIIEEDYICGYCDIIELFGNKKVNEILKNKNEVKKMGTTKVAEIRNVIEKKLYLKNCEVCKNDFDILNQKIEKNENFRCDDCYVEYKGHPLNFTILKNLQRIFKNIDISKQKEEGNIDHKERKKTHPEQEEENTKKRAIFPGYNRAA